jgi:hypothetical protein
VALDRRVNGELDGSGQPQPSWRDRHRPGEHPCRRARPDQVLLQDIQAMSVLRKILSVTSIEPLRLGG